MSNNQDQINSKDFLIGTLIGGIVGASIALLWAPKSGRELRSNINEQAHIAKEKGEKLAESAKQKTTILLDKVKNAGCCAAEEETMEEQPIVLDEGSVILTSAEEEVAAAVSESAEAIAENTEIKELKN